MKNRKIIDGIIVDMNEVLDNKEVRQYIQYVKSNTSKDKVLTNMDLVVDGEDVSISCTFKAIPFEKIRRITGYLVGTVDRFNDGKKAEELDRVKHSL